MVKVTLANLSYLQEIYELEKSLFLGEAYSLHSLKSELEHSDRKYYIALSNDNKVVAYLGVNVIVDFAEIIKIGVKKEFQRQGIAKKMFLELINALKQQKLSKIMLEVNINNSSAISLYNSMEFKKVAERSNYYKNGDTAVIMEYLL